MPFSSENGKHETDRVIQRLLSQGRGFLESRGLVRVLDIGAGSGTYSDRYRSMIENRGIKAHWTGVEIWEPYVEKYDLRKKYDALVVQDARTYAESISADSPTFDIAFVGDILEHMTKTEAENLMSHLLKACRVVVLSIPIIHYPQGEWEGNPYEAHIKDDWSDGEVRSTWGTQIVHGWVEQEIGGYILSDSPTTRMYVGSRVRPRIGVYAIGKNESQLIDRWIDYVTSAMDDGLIRQIVYVDTGSTDGTYEKVQNYKDYIQSYQVHVMPWRFDEGKNTALALLGEDLDFAVSIDIDEYVDRKSWEVLHQHLMNTLTRTGRLPERVHHSFKTIWDWEDLEKNGLKDESSKSTSSHYHDRIHSRFGWKWSLPVHEILEFQHNREPIVNFSTDFWMLQKPLSKEGRSSYVTLLEQSVRERPDVWKSWSFLAQEYLKVGRNDDALAAAESAERAPNADQGYLLHLKSFIYYDPRRKCEAAIQAANLDKIREYFVYATEHCLVIKDYERAAEMLNQALQRTVTTTGYKYDASCWSGPRIENLAAKLVEVKNEGV